MSVSTVFWHMKERQSYSSSCKKSLFPGICPTYEANSTPWERLFVHSFDHAKPALTEAST
jgi:hypothetical protein